MEMLERRLRTPEERVGMLPNASLPPPVVENDDEELLHRALRLADEDALRIVADRLFPGMLRIAKFHVGTRAAAEEIVQETWLAAIRGIDRFEGRSSIRTWLFRILRNLARTRGRRDARTRAFSDLQPRHADGSGADTLEPPAVAGTTPLWMRTDDPAENVLSAELGAHIDRAIATLPDRQREVLVLRDVEGWSADEVCNMLGISQTNQRVILHRARDRVRRQLRGYLADTDICGDDEGRLY